MNLLVVCISAWVSEEFCSGAVCFYFLHAAWSSEISPWRRKWWPCMKSWIKSGRSSRWWKSKCVTQSGRRRMPRRGTICCRRKWSSSSLLSENWQWSLADQKEATPSGSSELWKHRLWDLRKGLGVLYCIRWLVTCLRLVLNKMLQTLEGRNHTYIKHSYLQCVLTKLYSECFMRLLSSVTTGYVYINLKTTLEQEMYLKKYFNASLVFKLVNWNVVAIKLYIKAFLPCT